MTLLLAIFVDRVPVMLVVVLQFAPSCVTCFCAPCYQIRPETVGSVNENREWWPFCGRVL